MQALQDIQTKYGMTQQQIANVIAALSEQVRDASGNDVLRFRANVKIELFGPGGELKEAHELHNLICTAGKQQVLKASSAKYLNQFAYVAIGSNATAAAITDTTLGTEVARSSVITPTNPDANTLQFVATFGAGVGTGTITEYGLLDASSAGNLLSHIVSGSISKAAGDSLQVTYTLT